MVSNPGPTNNIPTLVTVHNDHEYLAIVDRPRTDTVLLRIPYDTHDARDLWELWSPLGVLRATHDAASMAALLTAMGWTVPRELMEAATTTKEATS